MLSHFNIAIVCSRIQGPIVEEALKQCIDHVEIAYYYDQSISCSGTYVYIRMHRILITIACLCIDSRWWV